MSAGAIKQQLDPASIEVSMAGDMPLDTMKALAMVYLGTVPPATATTTGTASHSSDSSSSSVRSIVAPVLRAHVLGKQGKIGIFQSDSDERAMGYLAGPAPNNWGVMHTGKTITELLAAEPSMTKTSTAGLGTSSISNGGSVDDSLSHRSHPTFAFAALKVLEEV